jgi:formamidopyrimidine-DNA glycosylase
MPELPEVETVRRLLDPAIVGRTITGVTLHEFAGVLESTLPGVDPAATIPGRLVLDTIRRGKYLIVFLDASMALVIHLRMTGRLLLLPRPAPPVRFEHLALHFDDGVDVRFADQRKFGRVLLASVADVERLDRALGPEPDAARLTPAALHVALARRSGKIKNALLDQTLIAGLGNIYVDEALYRARIHPERASNTLTIEELKRLLRAIRVVLNRALQHKGTTFSSFEDPYGEAGGNSQFLRVYGRSGDLCTRCGTRFERIVVGGRGTTFCPHCQVNVAPGA